jgi:hypothetical protein
MGALSDDEATAKAKWSKQLGGGPLGPVAARYLMAV